MIFQWIYIAIEASHKITLSIIYLDNGSIPGIEIHIYFPLYVVSTVKISKSQGHGVNSRYRNSHIFPVMW